MLGVLIKTAPGRRIGYLTPKANPLQAIENSLSLRKRQLHGPRDANVNEIVWRQWIAGFERPLPHFPFCSQAENDTWRHSLLKGWGYRAAAERQRFKCARVGPEVFGQIDAKISQSEISD